MSKAIEILIKIKKLKKISHTPCIYNNISVYFMDSVLDEWRKEGLFNIEN